MYNRTCFTGKVIIITESLERYRNKKYEISLYSVFNAHEYVLVTQRGNICPLLHVAFLFLLQEIGITIIKHPSIMLPVCFNGKN